MVYQKTSGEKLYTYHFKIGNCVLSSGQTDEEGYKLMERTENSTGGHTILVKPGKLERIGLVWEDTPKKSKKKV